MDDILELSRDELKAALASLGLSTSGTKAVLAERLRKARSGQSDAPASKDGAKVESEKAVSAKTKSAKSSVKNKVKDGAAKSTGRLKSKTPAIGEETKQVKGRQSRKKDVSEGAPETNAKSKTRENQTEIESAGANDFQGKTVTELKEILKSMNLPVSGTKAVLIERIRVGKEPKTTAIVSEAKPVQSERGEYSDVDSMTYAQLRTALKELGLKSTGTKAELAARLESALEQGRTGPSKDAAVVVIEQPKTTPILKSPPVVSYLSMAPQEVVPFQMDETAEAAEEEKRSSRMKRTRAMLSKKNEKSGSTETAAAQESRQPRTRRKVHIEVQLEPTSQQNDEVADEEDALQDQGEEANEEAASEGISNDHSEDESSQDSDGHEADTVSEVTENRRTAVVVVKSPPVNSLLSMSPATAVPLHFDENAAEVEEERRSARMKRTRTMLARKEDQVASDAMNGGRPFKQVKTDAEADSSAKSAPTKKEQEEEEEEESEDSSAVSKESSIASQDSAEQDDASTVESLSDNVSESRGSEVHVRESNKQSVTERVLENVSLPIISAEASEETSDLQDHDQKEEELLPVREVVTTLAIQVEASALSSSVEPHVKENSAMEVEESGEPSEEQASMEVEDGSRIEQGDSSENKISPSHQDAREASGVTAATKDSTSPGRPYEDNETSARASTAGQPEDIATSIEAVMATSRVSATPQAEKPAESFTSDTTSHTLFKSAVKESDSVENSQASVSSTRQKTIDHGAEMLLRVKLALSTSGVDPSEVGRHSQTRPRYSSSGLSFATANQSASQSSIFSPQDAAQGTRTPVHLSDTSSAGKDEAAERRNEELFAQLEEALIEATRGGITQAEFEVLDAVLQTFLPENTSVVSLGQRLRDSNANAMSPLNDHISGASLEASFMHHPTNPTPSRHQSTGLAYAPTPIHPVNPSESIWRHSAAKAKRPPVPTFTAIRLGPESSPPAKPFSSNSQQTTLVSSRGSESAKKTADLILNQLREDHVPMMKFVFSAPQSSNAVPAAVRSDLLRTIDSTKLEFRFDK